MEVINSSDKKHVTIFFTLTIAWTWLFWGIPALESNGLISLPMSSDIFTALGGLGPLLVALPLTYATRGKEGIIKLVKRGADFRFEKKWWIPLIFLIPVIFLVSYFMVGLFQIVPALDLMRFLNRFPLQFVYFFFGVAVAEEFGWRGYALDRLQTSFQNYRYTAVISSVVLGIVWGFWHLPFFYTAGTSQAGWSFWLFLWLTVMVSILFTWLYNNTNGSVLTALIFHTTLNLCVNFVPIFLIHFYYPSLTTDFAFIVVNILTTAFVMIVVVYWGPKNLAQSRRKQIDVQSEVILMQKKE